MIKKLLTLSEVLYWISVIRLEVWDDKDRRGHLFGLVWQVFVLIGIPASALTALLWINVGSEVGLDNKLDPVFPDVKIVVPMQPGPDFNTLAWCRDSQTTKDTALAAKPEGEPRIILVRGIERINWAGLPTTYQAEWKSTLADGSEQTSTVPMPKEAQDCFKDKAR